MDGMDDEVEVEAEVELTPLTRKEKAKGFWQKNKTKKKEEKAHVKIAQFMRKRERQSIDNSRFEVFPMCGFQVKLPEGIQPYPTQKLMMVKILTALNHRQNVIAESPTGSGKTLALLASTCAWYLQYKQKYIEARKTCPEHSGNNRSQENKDPMETPASKVDLGADLEIVEDLSSPQATKTPRTYEEELSSDFTPARVAHTPSAAYTSFVHKAPKPAPIVCTCLPKVSKIYYGTRTHKQIGQVVKEFRRLPYAGVIRHTIMASRDQSCINEAAKKAPDTTSYCKELISEDGLGCQYRTNIRANRLEVPQLMRKHVEMHTETIFDIEDLVDAMKVTRPAVCPYFATTRILTSDADIVFTPFTYLVDPIIRNSSDVTLKDSIVILDEAHNIEDTCREGASFTFTEKEIADALYNFKVKESLALDKLQFHGKERRIFEKENEKDVLETLMEHTKGLGKMVTMASNIYEWFKECAMPLKKVAPDRFSGARIENKGWAFMADSLKTKNLLMDKEKLKECWEALSAVAGGNRQEGDEGRSKIADFIPNSSSVVMIEKFIYFLQFFESEEFRSTYRLNITIEPAPGFLGSTQFNETKFTGQGPKNVHYNAAEAIWMDANVGPTGMKAIMEGHKTTVNMWCMSPALTFMDAFEGVRTIILASGTLCPMETLKTELGTKFNTEVEGKQVIASERIFASVLKVGPTSVPLTLTQSRINADKRILPEIVNVIKKVCLTVPKGVLVFMPSYKMLSDIMNNMRTRRIDSEIGVRKIILEEPKRSYDLTSVMNTFEEVMNHPKQFGPAIDGVLMLAVFRGKISEGIDFADDKARVVISLGIPYPNWGDAQVQEKRRYNDENALTRGILNGDGWYTTQAYRALNQALGRCLRHKNDWGALVLVDDRLVNQATNTQYGKGAGARSTASSAQVSKWIREELQVYEDYNSFDDSLASFVERMTGGVKKESIEPEGKSSSRFRPVIPKVF